MDMNAVILAVVKLLIDWAIKAIGASILPWLGTLLGGPFGWLVGIGISLLTKFVAQLIYWKVKFFQTDVKWEARADDLTAKAAALLEAQKDKNATPEDRAKKLADAIAAARALTDYDFLQSNPDKR